MVCLESVDHTLLEAAHGNAGTCFSTSVTNCIWQYLNLLNKEQEGIQELVVYIGTSLQLWHLLKNSF